MYTTGNTTNSVLSLSPELMKELAEYAVKEHRAGRCLTQEQVEKSVMETMGWSSPSCHEQEVVVSDCFIQMADAELDRMWNEGTFNEERIESFRHLHERTPYKLKKEIIMEGMYIVLGGVGIVACCLYLWSAFTKSGKKWIESL